MNSKLSLKITEINKEYDDTICLTLEEVENSITDFKPGQFLTLLIDDDGEEVRRGFSIASSPDELPKIMLAIKKVDDGIISNYIYDKVKPGNTLKALAPMGNFTVTPDSDTTRHLIMFGMGSGITPLLSQLKAVLSNEPCSKITLHYGSRNETSIIYYNEIEELSNTYKDRLEIFHHLTAPSENWSGLTGRITREKINDYLNSGQDTFGVKVEYYMCGPEEMMSDISELLQQRGVGTNKIHREIYHTSVVEEDEEIELTPREVTLIFNGEPHNLIIEPDKSILETALAAGLELPNSCQFGSCASCKAKLLSGKMQLVDQTALTEEQLEQGYCLTCVGHPASDGVVILYESEF